MIILFKTVVFAFLSTAATSVTAADWKLLFNGTDLAGWRANRDADAFTVTDGVLRVNASSRTTAHLFFIGDHEPGFAPFANFELRAEVRAKSNSNGGIFFHTDMTTRDKRKHLARGYEVQLNSSKKEKRKTGSLYAIVDLDESPVDETEWFTVRIVVQGKRIRVFVDDKQVVDYTEPYDVTRPRDRRGRVLSPTGGAIALQAHDPESVWFFRDIRVRHLKMDEPSDAPESR